MINKINKKHNTSFIANLLYLILIVCMFAIISYLIVTYSTNTEVIETQQYNKSLVNTNILWYDENNNLVENTSDLLSLDKTNTTIYCIIPENINIGDSISFISHHIYFTMSIDNEVIFTQLDDSEIDNSFYTKSFGTQLISYPLLQSYAGKKLTINYNLVYDDISGGIYNVSIGSDKDSIISFIQSKLAVFQLSYTYVIIGSILLLLYLIVDIRFKDTQPPRLLYLGLIAIIVGIYCMLESHLPTLFITNKRIMHLMTSFSIIALPLPFILFANSIYKFKHKYTLTIFSSINLLFFIINLILNICNISDYRENILFAHIMVAIAIISMFYSIIRYIAKYCITKYENVIYVIFMIIGLLTLTICGIIDIFRFYAGNESNDAIMTLRIGFLIFIICYSISSSGKIIDAIKSMAKIEVMTKLAYEDNLTGLRNRTAYSEKLNNYIDRNIDFGIIMLDVNNLKTVNDTHGHDDGDFMLQTSASMIQKVFCKPGMHCYRIGGDEFVVLVNTKQLSMDCLNCIENLEEEFKQFNLSSNLPYSIIIASGFSIYDPKETDDINQTLNEADEKMYARKKELKKLEAVK